MNWSYEDNKICSRAVIEYFVTGKNASEDSIKALDECLKEFNVSFNL